MRRPPSDPDHTNPGFAVRRGAADLGWVDTDHPLDTSIVDGLPDMVFAKDAESLQFIMMNRAGEKLLGWGRDDLITKTDHDLFPGGDAERFRRQDRSVLTAGATLDIPEEAVPTRRGTRIVHTTKVPFCDKSGKPIFLMGISRDVTDLQERERERTALLSRLQSAVRARDDLLALVSHDLKNPLNAIVMSTQVLAQESSPYSRAFARRIRRAAEHMNGIVENLIDSAAIEAGQFRIAPRDQDVASLIDDAIELTSSMTSERGQRLERVVDGSAPRVFCDRDLIVRVFANLIGNAAKFTPPGGSITVSARGSESRVCFEVHDTGAGIAADALPHVFERYWQAMRSASGSAGLGLFIVKGIVEAHAGTVWATSPPGKGTTISFELPASEEALDAHH